MTHQSKKWFNTNLLLWSEILLLCVIGATGKKNVFQESPLNQKEKRPNLFHKENKAVTLY